jgi:hypothetical protein
MKMDCLDTGKIQAFLDGELTPAAASGVSAHIALCDACAAQLATAEEESAFVFSTLDREIDTLVPTQRLWNKINDSIEVERHNAPFWKNAWAFITVSLANPSIAAAAAFVVVFAVFAAVLVERQRIEPSQNASNTLTQQTVPSRDAKQLVADNSPATVPGTPVTAVAPSDTERDIKPQVASLNEHRRSVENTTSAAPTVRRAAYIPGEESYVKTIATLSQTVDNQKEVVLRPSERVSYERDLAVVNDAIAKMKKAVRQNPKNESAKQVLYTSYQNKIDLLNSVSQREELVASLKD